VTQNGKLGAVGLGVDENPVVSAGSGHAVEKTELTGQNTGGDIKSDGTLSEGCGDGVKSMNVRQTNPSEWADITGTSGPAGDDGAPISIVNDGFKGFDVGEVLGGRLVVGSMAVSIGIVFAVETLARQLHDLRRPVAGGRLDRLDDVGPAARALQDGDVLAPEQDGRLLAALLKRQPPLGKRAGARNRQRLGAQGRQVDDR
jgi:hypothetical protein